MTRTIFRKKALEKLSSPDNIHEMVQVTSSRSWLALLALVSLVIFLIAWSFFGELPKSIQGQGILIQSGGLAEVTLLGSGIVNQLLVEEGDYVQKDDTLAIVAQPELQLQIRNLNEKLAYLSDKRNNLVRYSISDTKIRNLYEQKYRLLDKIDEAESQERLLEERLTNSEKLYVRQGLNREKLNRLRLEYLRAQRADIVFQNQLQKVKNQLVNVQISPAQELESLETEIQDLKREIDELNVRFTLSAYVKSPYEGKIIELMTKKTAH
ncbi:MAG: NHLP bacteriocin system secretion protein [Bacteroidia bacterium]|nr:NHLP bacteriocin system secretion protein [Bacteroidia bacterium]